MRRVTAPTRRRTQSARTSALAASLAGLALGAAACSSSPSATKASLAGSTAPQLTADALRSIGASPDVQLDLSLAGSQLGSATSVANGLHLVLEMSSTDPTKNLNAIGMTASGSTSSGAVAVELRLETGSTALLDVIETAPTSLFVRIDPASVLKLPLPFTPAQKTEIAQLEPFLGGRWYSIPPSLLKTAASRAVHQPVASGKLDPGAARALATSLGNALLGALDFTRGAPPASGGQTVVVTGTLKALVDAALPPLSTAMKSMALPVTLPVTKIDAALAQTPVDLKGEFSLDPAGTLTALRLSTAVGAVTLRLEMTVGHATRAVSAPAGAVALPSSLFTGGLGTLGGIAGGLSTPSTTSA